MIFLPLSVVVSVHGAFCPAPTKRPDESCLDGARPEDTRSGWGRVERIAVPAGESFENK